MDSPIPPFPRLAMLTDRQNDVMRWVAAGKANGDIARILECTEWNIKKHLQHVFPKFGVETRTAAAIAYLQAISALTAHPLPPDSANGAQPADPKAENGINP